MPPKAKSRSRFAILVRRGDIREVRDTEQRRTQIAREYLIAHEAGALVLVVSPANDERRELNKAIRAELLARGQVDPLGQEHTVLVGRNLAGAQRATAYKYEVGDVIRFFRGSKQFAISKGGYARVEAVDRDANMLTISTGEGRRVGYNPTRLFGVEVFRKEQRVLARGDRIQFRAPDRALHIANGDFAALKFIDARRAVLRLDNGKELSVATDHLRHIDHGYASTSHSAQGATVDRVNRRYRHPALFRAREPEAILCIDQPRAKRNRDFYG
jgi:ATP-dependent exoDNAse (exonuclease V) alpha subunit